MKNNKILFGIGIIFLFVIAYFVYQINNDKSNNVIENAVTIENIQNTNIENSVNENNNQEINVKSSVSNKIHTDGGKNDEVTPSGITHIELTVYQLIASAVSIGTFSNENNLSDEEFLKAAYTVINNGYVEKKNSYSIEEIDNIVYSLFNQRLSEYVSVEGLKYEKGKYAFTQQESKKTNIEIQDSNSAAGTRHISFLYEDKGYLAAIMSNTLTEESYVYSISEQ